MNRVGILTTLLKGGSFAILLAAIIGIIRRAINWARGLGAKL